MIAPASTVVTRTCRGCPTTFAAHPENERTYCSVACANRSAPRSLRSPNGTRVRRVCLWCSTPFHVLPSTVRNGRGIYCGLACSGAAMNAARWTNAVRKPPSDVERVDVPSCCPYTRQGWPTVGHEHCVLGLADDALTCFTHGADLAEPHHPGRPCDACKPRWRVS